MSETMTELDDILAHYGVKGMKWGKRKAETPRQKDFRKAAKTAGKVAAVAAAVALTAALAKNGNVPVGTIAKGGAVAGAKAASSFDKSVWDKSVKSLSDDIANANFEQDQWMRSLGLGAIVNNR